MTAAAVVPDYSAAMVTAVAVSSLFSCYFAAVAEIPSAKQTDLSRSQKLQAVDCHSAVSRHLCFRDIWTFVKHGVSIGIVSSGSFCNCMAFRDRNLHTYETISILSAVQTGFV